MVVRTGCACRNRSASQNALVLAYSREQGGVPRCADLPPRLHTGTPGPAAVEARGGEGECVHNARRPIEGTLRRSRGVPTVLEVDSPSWDDRRMGNTTTRRQPGRMDHFEAVGTWSLPESLDNRRVGALALETEGQLRPSKAQSRRETDPASCLACPARLSEVWHPLGRRAGSQAPPARPPVRRGR
jgi:hypothetical protein